MEAMTRTLCGLVVVTLLSVLTLALLRSSGPPTPAVTREGLREAFASDMRKVVVGWSDADRSIR